MVSRANFARRATRESLQPVGKGGADWRFVRTAGYHTKTTSERCRPAELSGNSVREESVQTYSRRPTGYGPVRGRLVTESPTRGLKNPETRTKAVRIKNLPKGQGVRLMVGGSYAIIGIHRLFKWQMIR